jgi:U3 small nucleolar RNA-associated protein 13
MELWTGSTDGRVRVFDLVDSGAKVAGGGGAAKAKAVLEGHVSVVRGIDVSEDGRWAITGGRDKVVLIWDLLEWRKGKGKGGPKVVQTIVAQEQVESLGLLPNDAKVLGTSGRLRCWTGGDRGVVRVWDGLRGEEIGSMKGAEGVDEAEVDEDEQRGIISVLCVQPEAQG